MDIPTITAQVSPILKQYGIKKAALFGSYVHGDASSKSDIDILVDSPKGKSLFDFIGLQLQLEAVMKKKVDLVTFTGLKSRIRDAVLKDQVRIL